jgi:hypothetical protein
MRPGRRSAGKALGIVLVCLLVAVPLVVAVGPAMGAEGIVVGRPILDVYAPDNRVVGGEQVSLDVFVSNAGEITRGGPAQYEERVTTARNVRIDFLEDEFPDELAENVEVLTGTVPAGVVPQGTAGPFEIRLEVDEGIEPGTYDVPVELAYDYTWAVRYSDLREPEFRDASREDRETLTLVVRDRPRFEVSSDGPVVTAGDTAVRTFTVTNVGSDPATNASLALAADESPLSLGGGSGQPGGGAGGAGGATARASLGDLAPGESGTATVRVGAPADLPPGGYPLTATVEYRSTAGIVEQSRPVSVSVPVGAEQTFAVTDVTDTLQVGETGTVSGTVTNTGDKTVSNAVVVFPVNATGLQPRAREYAVGTLEPGESATFEFAVDTPNGTTAGPRVLPFTVRYRNPGDDVRVSSPVDAPVTVAGEQTFDVRSVESDLQVGASGTLTGTVVNTGDRQVSGAVVVFGGSDGIQPRETRYPVGTLEPGETPEFQFPAEVAPTVEAGPQFVTFRVRYRGGDDRIRQSGAIDATVQIGPEQTFAVRNVTSTLQAGETGTVSGTVVNTGTQAVTEAAVVFATNGTSIQPRNREVAVGTLEPGQSAPFSFTADVPRTAGSGPRPLLFQVRYRDADDELRTSDPVPAGVEVAREQTFAIEDATSTLRAGERGRVVATLRNTGTATTEDVRLVYTGEGPLQPLANEAAAGTLGPDDTAQVSFTFDVPRDADPGRRSLPFVVQYLGRDGETRTTPPLSVATTIAEEQTFALENATSTLQVDDTGTVTAELVNTGDVAAEGIVVVVQETGPMLVPRETEYAVDSLAPGERAPVEFRFDATADAEPGPRLLTFRVRYRGQRNQVQTTDDIDATVGIEPQRDEFVVTAVNATVPAGEAEIVTLRVHNLENETLRDVRARLFVDDPLTSDNSEAFVSTLGPNETATLRFEVSAGAGAVAKEYPLLVDFTYEDESGESVLSDTYFVPLDVVTPASREFPVPIPVVLVIVALVVIGVLLYWQRERVTTALGRE